MNAFADGQRTNNLDMPGFMKVLSESDRDAVRDRIRNVLSVETAGK